MAADIQTIRDELVQEFMDALATLPHGWEHAAVNYEQGPEDPAGSLGPPTNYLAIYLARQANGELNLMSIRALPPAMLLFQRLHLVMADAEATWGSADLTLAAAGDYELRFDYAPPKRLSGIHDEASYGRFMPAR